MPQTLKQGKIVLSIDLKPALTMEQLDQRVLRDFEDNMNKQFKNAKIVVSIIDDDDKELNLTDMIED